MTGGGNDLWWAIDRPMVRGYCTGGSRRSIAKINRQLFGVASDFELEVCSTC